MAKMTLKQMWEYLKSSPFYCELQQSGYVWKVYDGRNGKPLAVNGKKNEAIRMAYAAITTPQTEPAAPAVEAVVPDVLVEKNARIAELEAEVERLKKQAANDSAYMTKLEGDCESFGKILIEAGKQVESLKAENTELETAIKEALPLLKRTSEWTSSVDDAILILEDVVDIPTPAQEAPKPAEEVALTIPLPKFTVGQAVLVVYNYGREFGLSNKAAEIVEIKQEDRANWYRVRYVLSGEEGTQFWEEYKILPREETKPAEEVTLEAEIIEFFRKRTAQDENWPISASEVKRAMGLSVNSWELEKVIRSLVHSKNPPVKSQWWANDAENRFTANRDYYKQA